MRSLTLEMLKRKKANAPLRYQRLLEEGTFVPTKTTSALPTGTLVQFTYGRKQEVGEVGGWKNDPRPKLVVFYDDGQKYIEGININYLPNTYLSVLMKLLVTFPGITGEQLYKVVKLSAPNSILKGYRKYIRSSFRNVTKFDMTKKPEKKLVRPKASSKLVQKKHANLDRVAKQIERQNKKK